MRGTRNRPSSAAGATASTSSRADPGAASSGRNTFTSGSGCAVGGTSCGVERGDLGRVLEDHAELGGERVDLVVGERKAGELGDVLDVGARQAGGHRVRGYL